MKANTRLLFGPIASVILLAAVGLLPLMVPGYDAVRQTVSEIGEVGSPARWPFTASLLLIALCLLIFASAIWQLQGQRTRIGAVLVGAMAISVGGVGMFAFPHPLHNVFGETELIGYLAPLAFAISAKSRTISWLSWLAFALLWASIATNLGYLGLLGEGVRAELHPVLQPAYGLVQRSLFVIWFGWCAVVGLLSRQPQTG
jgi:hypothetical membrane protein